MTTGLYLAADVSVRRIPHLMKKIGTRFEGVKAHMLTDPAARDRVKMLKDHGAALVWSDIKGHDTPDTVAGRAEALQACGVDIITVHASGGLKMMQQAVGTGVGVYAVVFLTSLTDTEFARYYQPRAVENMIEDAVEAKVSGFICPPTKVAWMRDYRMRFEHKPIIVTPGIRFGKGPIHDQQQVDTPGNAVSCHADKLVIGRMVTDAVDPVSAMDRLVAQIEEAEAARKTAGT